MIRPATPADVPAIRAIEAEGAAAAHWTEQQYAELFAGGTARLVLVAERGAVAGFLVACQIGPEWEIENIAVAGAQQRQGLGSALLAEFLSTVKGSEANCVFLEVRASNAAARSLYRKHGFVETGRRRLYYDHPAEDAVLYRLSLERGAGT